MGYEEEALSEKQMEKRTRDVERYAEQRLIMFKPYRTRDELKAGHETWYAALSSWLDEAASDDQYATAARHERDVYAFRQELLAEAELAGEEVGTPEPSDDEDDEDDENDPLVALSKMHPQAGLDPDVQKELAEDFDCAQLTQTHPSASAFPPAALFCPRATSIRLMKQTSGRDEQRAPAATTIRE